MSVRDLIDLAERIVVERWLRSPDTIEFTIDARYASEIQRGRFVYLPLLDFSTPLAFRITAIERDKKASSNKLTVHGVTIDAIALGGRRCWPSPDDYPLDTAGYDEQTGVPAETAMKHYVDVNAGPSSVAERQIPGFVVVTDAARGANVDVATRYQKVLDIVKEIAFTADLGWKVAYEAGTDTHNFDIIEPTDKSTAVFLDFEYDSISQWDETEIDASVTLAIVAGQGELTDRDIVIRPTVEPTGLERIEDFIDSTDIALGDTSKLEQRGDAHLAAGAPTRSVTVVARQEGTFQYPTDYGLGDYVSARDRERDLIEVKQVIGVRFTVEGQGSAAVPKVEPILDRPDPDAETRAPTSFSGGKVDLSAGGGGGAPSGPAGGDLGGTYPDPTVNDNSHAHDSTTVTTHSTAHGHGDLTGVTANQHHNQAHSISGADHTGTIAASQLDFGEAGDISTQAFGDAAAAGATGEVADAGHKHGMMANPVTAHEAASDPHTGYRLESADHSHASAGLQGGTVAHSVLTGVSENDHGRWTAIIVKPSDESVATSTALQNDDDFFFTTVNLAHYEFEMVILYINTVGNTGDLKMDFGEDSNNRGVAHGIGISAADAASSQVAVTNQTDTIVLGAATGERSAIIRGAFRGAGGTWRLRWAQNSSSGTTKILTGSVFRYRRIV